MSARRWFWILVGVTFFFLCPYTLVVTAVASLEMNMPAIYQLGNIIAWFFLVEAALAAMSPLSDSIERFNIWHLRQLLFIHELK